MILFVVAVFSQNIYFDFSDENITERLQKDVSVLASAEMEGREAGTKGEKKAVNYIKKQFQEIGIAPLFDDSFFQYFDFPNKLTYTENNTLQIEEVMYNLDDDYFIMPQSANTIVNANVVYVEYGFYDNYIGWNDYQFYENIEGNIFVMEYFLPGKLYKELDITAKQAAEKKIDKAIEKGAEGIIFVNSRNLRLDPRINIKRIANQREIPVIFAEIDVYEHLKKNNFDIEVNIEVEVVKENKKGINVAGYIDNNAPTTVIIGAHHDHLGYGGPTSQHSGKPKIHHGADDNASGVTGVLETARYLKNSELNNNNYLFITFSAEEKGLLGSFYFTRSNAYNMEKVNYMFNLDMIGRLEDNNLMLIGTGTSSKWENIIDENKTESFNIRKIPRGIGGSDHTAFYFKRIPAIFFFTGIHDDYHKPSDTYDKINFEGQAKVLSFAHKMIEYIDNIEIKLDFTSTTFDENLIKPSDDIFLGIDIDHKFEGKGLKIKNTTNNKPAQNIGIQTGDIITKINDNYIKDIHSYVNAIKKINEKDKINIVILRQGKEKIFNVKL